MIQKHINKLVNKFIVWYMLKNNVTIKDNSGYVVRIFTCDFYNQLMKKNGGSEE